LGNSLERTPPNNPQKEGFDLVLANPPWGWRADQLKSDRRGLEHYPFMTQEGVGLFVQHALQHLRPNGRAVLIVPEGLLFRIGPELRFRRYLLENHILESVVALPAGAFMPYSAIKASVIAIRREGVTKRIRMADAGSLFVKSKHKRPATIQEDQLAAFGKCLRSQKPGKHCWDVDVDTLSEVDWDLTPKRRDQSGLISVMDSLREKTDVAALKACCRITIGRGFKSDQLDDEPPSRFLEGDQQWLFEADRESQPSLFEAPIIPYIRIKDIQKGQATKGSSWLNRKAASAVDSKWKLKTGDVLLSKSGTIGKAGVVRNGGVGAVAAGGMFILRPDMNRLDPQFLSAYLSSHECRSWLDDRARGATIRHLTKRVLEEMPIPLPPLQIQQHVAVQYREHGLDALSLLTNLLIEKEDDPVVAWIENALQYFKTDKVTVDTETNFIRILNSKVFGGIFKNITLKDISESPLSSWITEFINLRVVFRNADAIPSGIAFYSLLQQAHHFLDKANDELTGQLPTEKKARELTRIIKNLLQSAMEVIEQDIGIFVYCDTSMLNLGEMVNIDLTLKNRGALPIRNIRVSTNPNWGEKAIEYLSENGSENVPLSGVAPKKAGMLTLKVDWVGMSFSGGHIEGNQEVAFRVVEPPDIKVADVPGLGGSPYVCGDPVRPERSDVFFGREELLEQIRRQVIQSGNVVLLEGNRRAGKSSILWHLAGANAVPGWLGAYCSLQGVEGSQEGVGVPTVEVFRGMAKSIAKAIQRLGADTPLPNGQILPSGRKLGISKACREGIGVEAPFSDFCDYAEDVLERLQSKNLGLLMMLDEFDKLQEGIDSGVTSPQVPENIRYLVQTYSYFSAILTGSRRLKRLREEYWSALYGIGTRFGVTSLPKEAARRLITEPVKDRLTYTSEAIERAIHLTAGQPYLLQCLCNRVFDMAAQLKTRSINLDLVNQAGYALIKDNEHFASLWDYAETDRRRFILMLCHKEASGPDPLQLGVIQEYLLSHGIETDDETLIADLEFLRELELVELIGKITGGHYALTIPLMGIWIEKQQDFAAVLSKARLETEDRDE
jgi:type I restriction enzyme M protein